MCQTNMYLSFAFNSSIESPGSARRCECSVKPGQKLTLQQNSITMYNVATQEWALQKTSGEPPIPSRNLCAVGVLGEEDTYEVGKS
jgi:hypothetical protein